MHTRLVCELARAGYEVSVHCCGETSANVLVADVFCRVAAKSKAHITSSAHYIRARSWCRTAPISHATLAEVSCADGVRASVVTAAPIAPACLYYQLSPQQHRLMSCITPTSMFWRTWWSVDASAVVMMNATHLTLSVAHPAKGFICTVSLIGLYVRIENF